MFQSPIILFYLLSFGFTNNLTCTIFTLVMLVQRQIFLEQKNKIEGFDAALDRVSLQPARTLSYGVKFSSTKSLERKIVEMHTSGSAITFDIAQQNCTFFCAHVPVFRRLFLVNWETLLLIAHISFEFCPEFVFYLLFNFDDRLFHCITIPSIYFPRPSILRFFSVYWVYSIAGCFLVSGTQVHFV